MSACRLLVLLSVLSWQCAVRAAPADLRPRVKPGEIAAGQQLSSFKASNDNRWLLFDVGTPAYLNVESGVVEDANPDWDLANPLRPSVWARQGNVLAFLAHREGRDALTVWSPDKGPHRELTQLPRSMYPTLPVIWSADGRTLYFAINQDLPWEKKPAELDEVPTIAKDVINYLAGEYQRYESHYEAFYEKEYPEAWIGKGMRAQRSFIMAVDLATRKTGLLAKGNNVEQMYLSPDGRSLLTLQESMETGGDLPAARRRVDFYLIPLAPVASLSTIDLETIQDRRAGWSDHKGQRLRPLLTKVMDVNIPGTGDYESAEGTPIVTWSPRSDSFVYVTTGRFSSGDVFVYEFATRKVRNLTASAALDRGTKCHGFAEWAHGCGKVRFSSTFIPLWTPDGKGLVTVAQGDAWYLPLPAGEAPRKLTAAVPDESLRIIPLPGLNVAAVDGGGRITLVTKNVQSRHDTLWKVSLQGGAADRIAATDLWTRYSTVNTDARVETLIFSGCGLESHLNVYQVGLSSAQAQTPKPLTSFKLELANKRFPRAIALNWKTAEGKAAYGVLYLPDGANPANKLPMVLQAEYTRVDTTETISRIDVRAKAGAWFYSRELAGMLEDGIAVFYPDIPMSSFGVYDHPHRQIALGVDAALDAVLATGFIDEKRMGMTGLSSPPFFDERVVAVLTQSQRLKAAVTFQANADWFYLYPGLDKHDQWVLRTGYPRFEKSLWDDPQRYLENSAIAYWNRIKTPLLMLVGAPSNSGDLAREHRMVRASQVSGHDMILAQYYNMYDQLTVKAQLRIRGWYREHLLGGKPISHIADQGSFIFTDEGKDEAAAGARP